MAINLGLIGAGGMGSKWARAVSGVRSVRLFVVADKDIAKAESLASIYKNCQAVSDWKAILKHPRISAVIIATPHKFLAPISRSAMLAKKHVLCEKPGGVNVEEIAAARAAAKKSGVRYMIGFNHRYHPGFLKAKDLVDRGRIGDILFVRARYGFGGRPGYDKEWRFNKRLSGGGELIDQGVHMIDLARWFLGGFSEAIGFTPNLFWKNKSGLEDNGFVLLQTPAGKVATIHVSLTQWKWMHSFEIMGSAGYLIIEGLDTRYGGPERLIIGKRSFTPGQSPRERLIKFNQETAEDSLKRELIEFVSAIKTRRQPLTTGTDAYEALKIVERIYAQNQ